MDEWSSTTHSPPRRGGEWTLHMERTLEASMPMAARNQDPDVELIERYFAGDTSAFDEIMIRYERQIYRVHQQHQIVGPGRTGTSRAATTFPQARQTASAETEGHSRAESQRTAELRGDRKNFRPIRFDDKSQRIFCVGKTSQVRERSKGLGIHVWAFEGKGFRQT